jgi:hypothetical protein
MEDFGTMPDSVSWVIVIVQKLMRILGIDDHPTTTTQDTNEERQDLVIREELSGRSAFKMEHVQEKVDISRKTGLQCIKGIETLLP